MTERTAILTPGLTMQSIPKKFTFFQKIGGRKQFNGYMGAVLLTAMAPFLGANFPEYSFAILGSLGLTSGLIALEDRDKKRFSQQTELHQTMISAPDPRGNAADMRTLNYSQIDRMEGVTHNNSNAGF